FLRGDQRPAGAAEWIELAQLCERRYERLHAAAARFYAKAFADDPKLAEDLQAAHRYNAACVAALAAAGQGKDAAGLEARERARLRGQALTWLRGDLAAWRRRLEKEPGRARPDMLRLLAHWQGDPDLAAVRGPAALSRLPKSERREWQTLWEEVA